MSASLGCISGADGSCLMEMGGTRVLAVVHGPRKVTRRAEALDDSGIILVSFTVAPFASSERRVRRAGDRKLVEASGALKQSYEAAVQLGLYPRSEITVAIHVLASDGGTLAAGLNAGTLALIDAGVAMKDFVVAASALYVQGSVLQDPSQVEVSSGAPELVVATLPNSGSLVLASMDSRLSTDAFQSLLLAAVSASQQLFESMRGFVSEKVAARLKAMEGGGIGAVVGLFLGAKAQGAAPTQVQQLDEQALLGVGGDEDE